MGLSRFGPNAPRPLDRPLVPHTLMPSHGSPGPTEVPDCPQTQAPNILWVQEKEPKYYCISKSPVNEHPSRFPTGSSMERVARYQSRLLHISGALLRLSFEVSSKWATLQILNGAPMDRDACFQSLPLPQGPSKGVFPHRSPTERDVPFPDPSFICHSRVSNKRNTPQVPQRSPYGDSCAFPEPSFTCLSVSPIKVLLIEKSRPSLEVPGKGSCSPKRDPYGKRGSFPEPYLTYPSGSPVKEPSFQVPLTELP